MRITVAICTWNRSTLLQEVLEQMTKLTIPPTVEWELLVVNNNSSDATDQVIASFAGRLPIRGLFEPKQGKSNALNLGVREASGDYILWTDDDVQVDENWMVAYWEAFNRWPQAAIFGGPIDPWFVEAPPLWLRRALPKISEAYGILDHGTEAVPLELDVVANGANMAVRTREQAQHLYDISLGPVRNGRLRGEETDVIQRMLAAGIEGRYVPDARVRHHIPRKHQTVRYLRAYFYGRGEYAGRRMLESEHVLFRRPRWLLRQAVEAEVKYRVSRLLAGPEVWIDYLKLASSSWGMARGFSSKTQA